VRSASAAERGSVVAEFAVAMPAVLLVLGLALGGVQVAALRLQAQDAAADAARSFARGDPAGTVASRLQRQVPGASLVRWERGDLWCVRVEVPLSGPVSRLGITAAGTSCALGGGR
jgi:hypothetical protein